MAGTMVAMATFGALKGLRGYIVCPCGTWVWQHRAKGSCHVSKAQLLEHAGTINALKQNQACIVLATAFFTDKKQTLVQETWLKLLMSSQQADRFSPQIQVIAGMWEVAAPCSTSKTSNPHHKREG